MSVTRMSVTRPDTGCSDDRGSVLVMFALLLVVLLGFAAIAIDIGAAYSVKRQDQGAVDTAALSAAVQGRVGAGPAGMIQTIKDSVSQNSPAPITDAAWAACKDPSHLPVLSTAYSASGSECISFGYSRTGGAQPSGITKIRVRLPNVSVATTFGRALGVNSILTHAVAVSEITSPFPFPSGLFADASAGDQICLLNGPSGNGGLCSSNSSGGFGMFQPYYYSISGCPSGGQGSGGNGPGLAIAQGIDHQLFPLKAVVGAPASPDLTLARLNGAGGCTEYFPNTVADNQGFTNQDITSGFVTGDNGQHNPSGLPYSGRLNNGPYWDGGPNGDLNTAYVGGLTMDNAPLWYFLRSLSYLNSRNAPDACKAAAQLSPKRNQWTTTTFDSTTGLTVSTPTSALLNVEQQYALLFDPVRGWPASPEILMAKCLNQWSESVGPIFTTDIAKTRRLTSVPRFWENSDTNIEHIRYFQPLYLDVAALKDNGNTARTGATWYAGDPVAKTNNTWNSGNFSNAFAGVVGQALPCDTMPATICKTQDGRAGSGSIGQVWLIQ